MIILSRSEIEALIDLPLAAQRIEDAYRATSRREVNLPPVGHITFPDHDADCHIKYGHLKGDEAFVIKVATGFPQNPRKGLSSGNGLLIVMSAVTGAVRAVLHDEMVLTDIRTGLGGAIASRALARRESAQALVVGTGEQARRQIEAHAALMPHLSFGLWGRDRDRRDLLVEDLAKVFSVSPAEELESAVRGADVVITATGSTAPLILDEWVQPGTHVTAVGADAPGKQELEVDLVARADVLAVDLASQCLDHGEVSHAFRAGTITADDVREVGAILAGAQSGRTGDNQITIADLTGIAAQDIAMANAVLAAWEKEAV